MVTLSREQAAALLKAAERRPLVRVLVTLGVATGARLGELLALRWQDVDLAAATVRLGWSRRIVKRRMQLKGPKTEAGYRTVRARPDHAGRAQTAPVRAGRAAPRAGRRLPRGRGSRHL